MFGDLTVEVQQIDTLTASSIGTDNLPQKAAPSAKKYAKKVTFNLSHTVPAMSTSLTNTNELSLRVGGGAPLFSEDIAALPDNFDISFGNFPDKLKHIFATPPPHRAAVSGPVSGNLNENIPAEVKGQELNRNIAADSSTNVNLNSDNNGTSSGYYFPPPTFYQIVSAEECQNNLMPSNVFGSSYIPYQGCNYIQMRSHAQIWSKHFDGLSICNQMPSLSTSTLRYDDMQHLGATGNMDHFVVEREKPMMKKPYKCNFCAKNQEKNISHQLKSETGEVLCPILREIICKICGATQANAHTPKFCPQKHRNRREPMTLDRHFPPLQEMNSSGT